MPRELREIIFPDTPRHIVIWKRLPDQDVVCPICLNDFRRGGMAWAYQCTQHYRRHLIGTQMYWCPVHRREVSPVMYVGIPLLAGVLVNLA